MNKKRNLNKLNNIRIPKKRNNKKRHRFSKHDMHYIDYKEVGFLSMFLNPQGRILPPRYTGLSRRHQARIARAIKRSRTMAYLPYVGDNLFQNS